MNIIRNLFSRTFLTFLILFGSFLSAEEWKKEVILGQPLQFILQNHDEELLVGSLLWAKEAVDGGKEINYKNYFYEAVSLMDEKGEELHIYGRTLDKTGEEWASSATGVSFSDYILAKKEWDSTFAKSLEGKTVRFFSDEERQRTLVHWKDGVLYQIGLDNASDTATKVPEGSYAFVLGNKHLYITPKIKTEKGRVQHSSFFRAGPVLSAGKIGVDKHGQIEWISNSSGHYAPGKKEQNEIINFLKTKMSASQFKSIEQKFKQRSK